MNYSLWSSSIIHSTIIVIRRRAFIIQCCANLLIFIPRTFESALSLALCSLCSGRRVFFPEYCTHLLCRVIIAFYVWRVGEEVIILAVELTVRVSLPMKLRCRHTLQINFFLTSLVCMSAMCILSNRGV